VVDSLPADAAGRC